MKFNIQSILISSFALAGIFSSIFLSTITLSSTAYAQASEVERLSWDGEENVELFWQRYLTSKGGITWERSSEYPDYDKVKEGDTFMVELKQGPCLMEFFHGRWRRANDVWRWGESMNEYAACPYVFD
ncbi:hypothetical protein [uncultured Pseudoteredinibacter sp.]|uniref:hypothetical protein n=1 Tax=uncultured Pseudoteredinibacter sp. TaxID=1641701 RepID=UPI00260FB66E|nr:hypothetical protein [uncultured Pseudoteredinibacter sp.]